MMIVWRLGEKIIRTVLCCIVYDSCAQWCAYAHLWTVRKFTCWFRFRFCFCVFV